MDLFLKTRVTVLKTTRRTMVGSWQCLGPRERVLLILKLIPKCHLGCGVLGLGVRTFSNLITSTAALPKFDLVSEKSIYCQVSSTLPGINVALKFYDSPVCTLCHKVKVAFGQKVGCSSKTCAK